MNIVKNLQTQIPDIVSVYGGVRGRTISSRHQAYAHIYKYMTEQNGVEPMPMEFFKARKKTINELSMNIS